MAANQYYDAHDPTTTIDGPARGLGTKDTGF